MCRRVWISWETQRRSIELAKKFGCELYTIEYNGIKRYPLSIIRTVSILIHEKPQILFVQNPSMILATLACICKIFMGFYLVVDRHTTFLLDRDYKNTFRIRLFKVLHHCTTRYADLTIVTNKFLADIVSKIGGNPFILPDVIPHLSETNKVALKGRHNILMISSFGIDEPVQEILQAMKRFSEEEVILYITGNYNKLNEEVVKNTPVNVIFTGFLDEQDYINMLFSVDAIIVLTTADACMLCGCYEATSVGKPLITSNKDVLRDYFSEAVFVDNTESGIAEGIKTIIEHINHYEEKMKWLRTRLIAQWEDQYRNLEQILSSIN